MKKSGQYLPAALVAGLLIITVVTVFVASGPTIKGMFATAVDSQSLAESQAGLSCGMYGGGVGGGAAPEVPGLAAGGTAIPNQEPYDLVFFRHYGVNPFIATEDEPRSTFGLDVDDASYAIARRFLQDGHRPAKDGIRTEEFINAFDQDYHRQPGRTFTICLDGAQSEFGGPRYHLLRIGLVANPLTREERRPATLIFVVDVSGSMQREDRLEQVKCSLRMLAAGLRADDRVGLVVYGSDARVLLEPTGDRERVLAAVERLRAEGSTNAEAGLRLAYEQARRHYADGRINRLVLCSDGVANVGVTDANAILERVRGDADKGITLTCLGFGMGNYNDVLLEQLASHGDGNYHYLETRAAAERLFADGATPLLQVVAEDARVQVEFNPAAVDRYRLLGYENRAIANDDFRADQSAAVQQAAGEIGAGHTVTALYEVRLRDDARGRDGVPVATVRLRYKDLATRRMAEEYTVVEMADVARPFAAASPRFRFIASVAECAELLKESYWAKDGSFRAALDVARAAAAEMPTDERDREYLQFLGGLAAAFDRPARQ